jgi:hypothetical protein
VFFRRWHGLPKTTTSVERSFYYYFRFRDVVFVTLTTGLRANAWPSHFFLVLLIPLTRSIQHSTGVLNPPDPPSMFFLYALCCSCHMRGRCSILGYLRSACAAYLALTNLLVNGNSSAPRQNFSPTTILEPSTAKRARTHAAD